ncbi:DEAD/DEAH box helicase [Desulfosarcina sp. OttesenSCG-928-B08]|nr:DEAD/DEAH box helicase [Desulfosarcina sp. OttesenSCG-928-B08]
MKKQTETIMLDMHQSMTDACRNQALAYNALSSTEQAVINLLAVRGTGLNRTEILKHLKRAFFKNKGVKIQTTVALKPILDTLAKHQLVHSSGHRFYCAEDIVDAVCRALVTNGFFNPIAQLTWPSLESIQMSPSGFYYSYQEDIRPKIRILVYLREETALRAILTHYARATHIRKRSVTIPSLLIPFMDSFDAKWAQRFLSADLKQKLAMALLTHFYTEQNLPMADHLDFCEALLSDNIKLDNSDTFCTLLAECRLMEGKPEKAEAIAGHAASDWARALVAADLFFLRGEAEKAVDLYRNALDTIKKQTKKKNLYFKTLSGLFFILALVKKGGPEDLHQAKTLTTFAIKDNLHTAHAFVYFLTLLITARQGDPNGKKGLLDATQSGIISEKSLNFLILLLSLVWVDRDAAKTPVLAGAVLKKNPVTEDSREMWPPWVRAELTLLFSGFQKESGRKAAEDFFTNSGFKSIVDLIQPESSWVQVLNTLISLGGDAAAAPKSQTARVVWMLSVDPADMTWDLYPLEQVVNASGNWSKGRKIATKRLYTDHETMPALTAQDRKVCKGIEMHISTSGWGYSTYREYTFSDRALLALAGHPLVFSPSSPSTRIDVVASKPALLVQKMRNKALKLAFSDKLDEFHQIQIFVDSPTRIRIMETDEEARRVIRIIGDGILIPEAGKDQLLKAVSSVSSLVTVQSEVDGIGERVETVPADPTPHFYLRPLNPGLKLDVRVQPFGDGGPLFSPGEGGETIISDIDGKRLGTRRDPKTEKSLANAAVKACAPLAETENNADSPWEWELADPETALEVLLALTELKDSVSIKWPDGHPLTIRQQADASRLSLHVKKQQDWFEVSGELKLDDGLVLSMEKLLELMQESKGRFITLSDGQFLALTRSLKKQLDEMSSFSRKSGSGRKFHPLAALSLEPLADEAGYFDGDAGWKAHLKRFKDAQSIQPELPSTLKADLRDYQVEGFFWLVRLMNWGVGACLADDMGLGKTLQALAALLTLAPNGPCLVVAPTSVCMNWEKEALRFAPSFRPVSFGTGNRDKILAELAPFDLLIISYGLLQQEEVAEKLEAIPFSAIVLDEAQAIKNFATKRSQAAMNLKADFKLITTGTPIENHLAELWNLFRFINPGLLGSLKSFNATFAGPIERDHDRNAGRKLKKLIRPFILRRTKDQVLEALPERTDVQLQVELSEAEMAFYEAVRRKALENIEDENVPAENKRMQILAEIMKLRRACCNARLVAPDMEIPSAKLETFGEIVDELLANGHKALVFSQFTGHLDIIRTYVEKKKITYQYLDGATPQKEREKRVTAFQAGKGDLFLISLRAGGVGLNLTAADYVIHMDPWWNPAVEDQASDRVHRIGQTRPVTVYRLVARGTIEEKIIGLHQSKRAIADSLLDGADMSGKMTAEELLALIREG